MCFTDMRAVYADNKVTKNFDNALYFFSRYVGSCSICISVHKDPQILPCGHAFCKECIRSLEDFSRNCPLCGECFWASKPVTFVFFEDFTKFVLFRKLETRNVLNVEAKQFYEMPYCCHYYELDIFSEGHAVYKKSGENKEKQLLSEDLKVEANPMKRKPFLAMNGRCTKQDNGAIKSHIFYQSIDGQFCFLNPRMYRNYKVFPEYIYGTVKDTKRQKMCVQKFPELTHIPHNYYIEIIELN